MDEHDIAPGLRIRLPIYLLVSDSGLLDTFRYSLECSYNLSRAFRLILFFLSFFLSGKNVWLTLLFSILGFAVGYMTLFHRDDLIIIAVKSVPAFLYHYLFRFLFIAPVAVLILSFITKCYFLILAYFLSLLLTWLLRFLIDRFWLFVTERRFGFAISPLENKAILLGYFNYFGRRTYNSLSLYRQTILRDAFDKRTV